MTIEITYRPISEKDSPLLFTIYCSAREEELATLDWTQQQKQAFLKMQFEMQHRYYKLHYKDARFELILKDNQVIGRLYTEYWQSQIRLIDIIILPNYRHQGIATQIIKRLQAEARASSRVLSLHVEKNNPALNLYSRLDFQQILDKDIHWFMQWLPRADAKAC